MTAAEKAARLAAKASISVGGVCFRAADTKAALELMSAGATTFTVPPGVKIIGASAFARQYALKTIILPEGLLEVQPYAFAACKSLQSITIPEGTISIGKRAFQQCVSLREVNVPDTVTNIELGAFEECRRMKPPLPTANV